MVPGKHIHIAMDIVNKLKSQYKLWDKKDLVVTKEKKQKKSQMTKSEKHNKKLLKRVKTDKIGEIWIKDEED